MSNKDNQQPDKVKEDKLMEDTKGSISDMFPPRNSRSLKDVIPDKKVFGKNRTRSAHTRAAGKRNQARRDSR